LLSTTNRPAEVPIIRALAERGQDPDPRCVDRRRPAPGAFTEAQEKMGLALGRVGQLFSFILRERHALEQTGSSPEQAFSFLAANLSDLYSFYEMMATLPDEDEVPF
jgi:hypothetical protein